MTVLVILFKWHLRFVYFFLKLIKTNNKKVLMMSRQSDTKSLDFKMIEENIHKRYPKYKVVVLTKKLLKKNFISYYFHIYKQMYHLATSRVCLVDTYIIPVSILKHKKNLTVIQICHGIGNLKKFGYQTLDNESGKGRRLSELMNMHSGYDYLISTSKKTSEFYAEAFNMSTDKMLNFGVPKIDYILNIGKKKKEVLKKYPHLKDKPVILYVCTFRTYEDDYLKKFADAASDYLDKYNVIMHIHPVAYKYHPDIDKYITDDRIYRCKDIQTADLLSVVDYAITDYSSFVFEPAILEIPTYLYVSDYDRYIEKNGLNVNIFEELPGYVFRDAKELFKKIDSGKYDKRVVRKFRNRHVENCKGTATKEIVDFIISKTK